MRKKNASAGDIGRMQELLRGRANPEFDNCNSNFSWSHQATTRSIPNPFLQGDNTGNTGVPGSIQFVPDAASTIPQGHLPAAQRRGSNPSLLDPDDQSSAPNRSLRSSAYDCEEESELVPPSGIAFRRSYSADVIQQTIHDAIANLGGAATATFITKSPSPRPFSRSMSSDTIRARGRYRPRQDDSKRTASTTGSSVCSELSRMEISIVQPPKPWQCICGLEHEEEYRFCGFCGTSKYWTCPSCTFERNKCQFHHCGGCGQRRELANRAYCNPVAA